MEYANHIEEVLGRVIWKLESSGNYSQVFDQLEEYKNMHEFLAQEASLQTSFMSKELVTVETIRSCLTHCLDVQFGVSTTISKLAYAKRRYMDGLENNNQLQPSVIDTPNNDQKFNELVTLLNDYSQTNSLLKALVAGYAGRLGIEDGDTNSTRDLKAKCLNPEPITNLDYAGFLNQVDLFLSETMKEKTVVGTLESLMTLRDYEKSHKFIGIKSNAPFQLRAKRAAFYLNLTIQNTELLTDKTIEPRKQNKPAQIESNQEANKPILEVLMGSST